MKSTYSARDISSSTRLHRCSGFVLVITVVSFWSLRSFRFSRLACLACFACFVPVVSFCCFGNAEILKCRNSQMLGCFLNSFLASLYLAKSRVNFFLIVNSHTQDNSRTKSEAPPQPTYPPPKKKTKKKTIILAWVVYCVFFIFHVCGNPPLTERRNTDYILTRLRKVKISGLRSSG